MKADLLNLAREVSDTLNAAVASRGITWHQAAKLAADYNEAVQGSGAEAAIRGLLFAEHRTKKVVPAFLVQTRNLTNLTRKVPSGYTV